jgi:hypothetical protein
MVRDLDSTLAVVIAGLFGCSSPAGTGSSGHSTGSGADGAGASAAAGGGTSTGGGLPGGGTSAGGGTSIPGGGSGGAAPSDCVSEVRAAEQIQVDLFIMMDRSGSMVGVGSTNGNIWVPIGTAVGDFVLLPEAAGLGVGIQFFPLGDDSCDVNLYATPAAPIAPLPGNADAIRSAIINAGPDRGRTPTLPAMQGAMQYAQSWATQSGHQVVVVLTTDGEPNVCNSTVDAVSQVAAQGFSGAPSIQTYVIGIGNVAGLNQIATAGGTDAAIIVQADPALASQQFMDAMNSIRGSAQIPCEYTIPEPPAGQDLDFQKVNVTFSVNGSDTDVLYVPDGTQCDADGGWHYDDPSAPTKILLCPATCTVAETQVDAQMSVGLGCATKVRDIR